MKRTLGLMLVLVLAGCVPSKPPAYQVGEVQLLFGDATERWDYFYGDPQTLRAGSQTLNLTAGGQGVAWAVPGTLSVNGQPVLREVSPASPFTLRASRSGAAITVQGQGNVRTAWVYDNGWSQLVAQGGQNVLVQGEPRFTTLTEAETLVVLQEILARRGGREVVLYELAQPALGMMVLEPAPQNYRVTTLAVQYGLASEGVAGMGGASGEVQVLRQGANSAYTDSAAQAYLATSSAALGQVWGLVAGNILPRPAPPNVDFSRSSIAAFFMGQRPTGGFGVRFVSAQATGTVWRVTVQLTSPAPGAITTQALTSPYLVLELPGRATQVNFVDASGQLLSSASAQ